MRITTITTADQRSAVTTAAIAAGLIQERLDTAVLAEFAAEDNAGQGRFPYRLLTVWSDGEDSGEIYCTRELLWSTDAEHGPTHGLSTDDVLRIETVIKSAGDLDPNIFGAGELAQGVWELDLEAILTAAEGDAAARLVELIGERGITDVDLDDLVDTAAATNDGQPTTVPMDVAEGGIDEQARYLIRQLGETEAFAAVGLLGRSA
jgi:hypothetical protein